MKEIRLLEFGVTFLLDRFRFYIQSSEVFSFVCILGFALSIFNFLACSSFPSSEPPPLPPPFPPPSPPPLPPHPFFLFPGVFLKLFSVRLGSKEGLLSSNVQSHRRSRYSLMLAF